MPQRRIKAAYRTVGPKVELVTYEKCSMDDTKSLQREQVTEKMNTWMVYLPNGNSVRFCGDAGFTEMKRLGLHLKPRMIDMDTGDVVDTGGDPYDFGTSEETSGDEIILDDSEEVGQPQRSRKKVLEHATQA